MKIIKMFEKLPTPIKVFIVLGAVFGLTGILGFIGGKIFS